MRKIKNLKITGLLALVLVSVMLVGSLAFLTDRISGDASFSTIEGGVIITPDPDPDDPTPDPDKLSTKWANVNAEALANFNPGDKLDLSYTLANTGELAVDVRETFVITSSEPLTDGSPEFRLFSTIHEDAAGATDGVNVVVTEKRIDANHYMYTIAPYTLNGSSESVNGVTASSVDKAYYLVFNKLTGNTFQGDTCTIDYVVEAKQHSDGGNADWVTAATGSLTLGGQTVKAVPAAPVATAAP